jgi:diketogulonate reductase-like aldo/keto reductase
LHWPQARRAVAPAVRGFELSFDAERAISRLPLAGGGTIPALGLGTWRLGETAARRRAEVDVVRQAIVLGYRLFDTAEMYGEGGAESVLGEAIAGAIAAGEVRREDLFIVSKVYPHNASRKGTAAACDRSRERLGLDCIDLYLLHWRGEHPLAETVAAMQNLVDAGRIGHWGVSNFDTADMHELADAVGTSGGGTPCASNQVYYSLSSRGPEFSLLPWMRAQQMPLMAYSPIDQGALLRDGALRTVGARHGASAAQVALAWILHQEGVVAIPKAANPAHLAENFRAASLVLAPQDLAELDRSHPAPRRKTQLSMR